MGPFEDLLSRLLTYSETQKVGHPIMSNLFCNIGLLGGGVVYPSIEFQGVSSRYKPGTNSAFVEHRHANTLKIICFTILERWNKLTGKYYFREILFFNSQKKKKKTRHHLFTVSISHKALGTNGEFSHIKGHQFVLRYSQKNVASICLFFMCIHTWILIALKSSSSSAHWEWEVPNEYAYNVKNNQNNIQSPLTVQAT